jgi:Mitochondrial small ribosomal subunit Rsm22
VRPLPPRGRRSPIHEGLVGERALIGQPYLRDPELRRGYQTEIAPRTTAALAKVLRVVFGPPPPPGSLRAPRVLDLGAGTGAAGAAARAFFGAATEIVAVDLVAGPGIITADLGAPGPVRGVTGRFDLIVAGHLLNELFVQAPASGRIRARADRVRAWCDGLLAPAGTFIVLEPALRETSRDLLAVRDHLLAAPGGLRVVAPCLWTGPCPAFARERDWCHDATFEPSEVVGQRPRRVDFSYLALRRDRGAAAQAAAAAAGTALPPPPADPALFRIVSDALVEKGRLRLFGCGPSGRHALVRLDRHRAPSNAAFDLLTRGDLARVAGTSDASDGRRLGPTTLVENLNAQVPAE